MVGALSAVPAPRVACCRAGVASEYRRRTQCMCGAAESYVCKWKWFVMGVSARSGEVEVKRLNGQWGGGSNDDGVVERRGTLYKWLDVAGRGRIWLGVLPFFFVERHLHLRPASTIGSASFDWAWDCPGLFAVPVNVQMLDALAKHGLGLGGRARCGAPRFPLSPHSLDPPLVGAQSGVGAGYLCDACADSIDAKKTCHAAKLSGG